MIAAEHIRQKTKWQTESAIKHYTGWKSLADYVEKGIVKSKKTKDGWRYDIESIHPFFITTKN